MMQGDRGTQARTLADGLRALELPLDAPVQERLLAYLDLLAKWNRVYNLTAVRDPQQMVVRHLLDSLAVVPHLPGTRILDAGTGAGLPGIPLALAFPERGFTLLDSSAKKIRFLVQALAELDVRNAEAVRSRIEDYQPACLFDTVVTRAFAALPEMVAALARLGNCLLAMKGTLPQEELARLPDGFEVAWVRTLRVPGLGAERHLICVRATAA